MKQPSTKAPRAPRAKAAPAEPTAPAAPTAAISQDQIMRIFRDNPGKVLTYRQLSRRLGVTTKDQREVVFAHLRELRQQNQLLLIQNDEYRLTDEAQAALAAAPKGRRKAGVSVKQDEESEAAEPTTEPGELPAGKRLPRGGRVAESEFGQNPVVHRRREAGFDFADADEPQSPRRRRESGGDTIVGTVALATEKYAFVISEETEKDVRVFTDRLRFAMQGDTVRVRLRDSRDGRPVGDVVEVLDRKRPEVVGRLQIRDHVAFVKADNRKLYFDVYVSHDDLNGAQNGDKVLVHVTEFPEDGSDRSPAGVIVRSFGQAGGNEAEINAIMAEFGLPFEFPAEVEADAEGMPDTIPAEEIARRRDFRDVTTFTIDPADAKDFDDALSIQQLENGRWEIGVHIADVTHYVRLDTALENEARTRATSVYLVDRVIPMLPEHLSNGLCSLRPNEDKLTFSAVFELDENGKLYSTWLGKTVIHSDRRFAYEDAQERIEGLESDYTQEVQLMNRIAKKLCAARFKQGAISFETQEVKFRLDENGKPLGVYVKERKDAHKMIEEFMLLANRKVAEFVFKLKKTKPRLTMVYRVHDSPDPERLQNFALFAKKFGYQLDLKSPQNLSTELNDLSQEVVGRPEQNVLQTLAIRTMAKATYTTDPRGHFGLAFEHYSHFTSPIRRYPDMMAHRLLEHYLEGGKNVEVEPIEEECKHSSEREKLAASAERASIKFKQVEFLQDHIGEQFTGVVSGLTEWGMYVEIAENKCEGMIRISDIPGDYFELDKDNYRLVGQRTKRIIQFGDELEVEVKAVNLLDRTIDFALVDDRPDAVKQREQQERRENGGSSRPPRGSSRGGKSGGNGGGRADGKNSSNSAGGRSDGKSSKGGSGGKRRR
ncbi:ribonuclease R [Hymenobacter actinosclerus]|uniref:Ribonuclease R n=1 Tax=Hymenobacter actinosclerus TaxID=82805 RepID=A0A1I0IXP0_9BACT|nr:ribonuclease R [Hymenobacter actinosclerus]SEU02181.1 RNAse R [Hymenobacter actinosclerus]